MYSVLEIKTMTNSNSIVFAFFVEYTCLFDFSSLSVRILFSVVSTTSQYICSHITHCLLSSEVYNFLFQMRLNEMKFTLLYY